MRRFEVLELDEDAIPDESTILRFRHLLECHGLAGKSLDVVGRHLEAQGLVVNSETIGDATIIAALPSTRSRAKVRYSFEEPSPRETRPVHRRCVRTARARDDAGHR
ncbi:MAG: hypothetical protein AAFY56_20140 [Pseudomonadota bacterium]